MLERGQTPILNDVLFEKWVYGGDALARREGRVLLAPYVLPGETARLRPAGERRGVLHARPVELLTTSPERVEPRCPYFRRCGGCHYQHTRYAFQAEQKCDILREVLQRVGKIAAPAEISLVRGEPWGYRNRIQLHLDSGRVGMHQAGSHRLCAIDQCPIASPALNQALQALNGMVRQRRFPSFLRGLELFTNESEVQLNVLDSGPQRPARSFFEWCAAKMPGVMKPSLDYPAAGAVFRVSHKSFFQVNRFLIDELVRVALEGAQGEAAVDLYSGVGLFALPLARLIPAVAAVESNRSGFEDLAFNAARAGAPVRPVRQSAEEYLELLESPPDFVLADPPRAGLGKRVVEQLIRLQPARLHIVSCDPATLARDLAGLLRAGYRLEQLTVVDFFPQTCHIESVAKLARG